MAEFHKVGHLLERTTRKVKLSFIQLFKDLGVDLTPEQWVIIDTLYTRDGLTQTQLADDGFKNAPTISRIIDGLVKKNLVFRKADQKDKRKSFIHITKEGKALVQLCLGPINELRDLSWQGLSADDYQILRDILDKVFDNLSNKQLMRF